MIVPEPLADNVSVAPLTLLAKAILPLLVVDKDKAPDELRAEAVVILLLLLTYNAEKVSPPEARLKA